MKRRGCVVPLYILLVAVAAAAQGHEGFALKASYDRPGLPVPHWELSIDAGGAATYTPSRKDGTPGEPRTFPFSASGLMRLRTALDGSHELQPCETKTKGIARMGQKTITYQPAGRPAETCSYNYTENKGLSSAMDYLQATALTLDDGAEMERLHRYDRLGLDRIMQQLSQFAAEGKAVELGSIQTELQSLAADALVLERVRSRAAQLLGLAERENAGTEKH